MNPVSIDCIYFQSMSFCIVFSQRIWNKILKFHKSVFNDGFEAKVLLRFYVSILSPRFSSDLVVTSYDYKNKTVVLFDFGLSYRLFRMRVTHYFFNYSKSMHKLFVFRAFYIFYINLLLLFVLGLPPRGCSRQSSYINLIRNNL